MGMFSNLMGKVFGAGHPAAAETAHAPTPDEVVAAANAAAAQPAAVVASADAPAPVDYEAVLDDMNEKNPEELDWRVSIVDLMKLVGMDSSLVSRKAMATELHYPGDMNDSASMNIWLHKQVMAIFANNGGKMKA